MALFRSISGKKDEYDQYQGGFAGYTSASRYLKNERVSEMREA